MKTMKRMTTTAAGVLAGLALSGLLLAGTLDPPGPPAPTMVTLQQIYDKVSGGVAKTGQTGCWNAAGGAISCSGTGQDAALQKGVSLSPRFTDNGDGTVRDNLTGLIWLKNANCFGLQSWNQALASANGLVSGACGLTDGSGAGTWRLANGRELRSLIDFGHAFPALPAGQPFTGVQSQYYWTSTTYMPASQQTFAISVNVALGHVGPDLKSGSWYVWPVRGGQ